ncbi:MAG: iron-containing alcohol dehydrogenase [Candidatus Heimdallarchaeaceae archaeon]
MVKEMEGYYNPVEIFFGISTLKQIGKVVEKYSTNEKILVISDKIMRKLGVIQGVENSLVDKGYKLKIFEKEMTNPNFQLIDESTQVASYEEVGLIVGLGGGSTLDCAKCTAILLTNGGKISNYLINNEKFTKPAKPLILIPTTAGTGSEVTMWATVWREETNLKKKYSLSDKKMYAKAAILDPELTLSLPPYITATTGLDALSQAIEAYWSRNHNPVSDNHALSAMRIIFQNLLKAHENPKDIEYREKMLLGSLESGLAFSNTKTTAVHSVSYPITAYFNIPHGLACALTLGVFLEFNSIEAKDNLKEAPQRIMEIVHQLQCTDVKEARNKLEEIMKKMNLPTRLKEIGIDKKGVELILKEGFTKGRVENNPRILTKHSLRELLLKIL